MFDPGEIRIADYNYPLPDSRIAQFPLANRDASKLLVYRQGLLSQDVFSNIGSQLPANSMLVFNDTRVIRARLIFTKSTGAVVEIFCLEPIAPVADIQTAFLQKSASTWKCLVGNLKRWKSGLLIHEIRYQGNTYQLGAKYAGPFGDSSHAIEFTWSPAEKTFSEILELAGLIPLPPYIHRPPENADSERYQTIFAAPQGSVAAPTAGLHFTESVLQKIAARGIIYENVTLHVGVGTFKPVIAERIGGHVMHHEKIVVSRKTIASLLNHRERPVFAVGTTSARTLESLYWLGVKLARDGNNHNPVIFQWDPYEIHEVDKISTEQALETLLRFLDENGMAEYSGETQLMIVPGYSFKVVAGLITNFHMPQSTLLLLVAALVGEAWKSAYEYALSNDFRFLSYGDSSLFFKPGL